MRLERAPEVKVKDWVQEVTAVSDITNRSRMVTFLLSAYGFLLVTTMALYFLEGFKPYGFHLEEADMQYLGKAVVGRDRRSARHNLRLFLPAAPSPISTLRLDREMTVCAITVAVEISLNHT
jgi:hypothetical protein